MSASAYTRGYGFGNYQTTYPTRPLPGNQADIELDAVAASTASLVTNLNKIQRTDGALANAIVTPDSLNSAVLAMFTAVGANPRGNWLTATAYAVKDIVSQPSAVYICVTAHTSGVFATDLAAGKWQLLNAAPANQNLNTTDSPTFAAITTTGAATVGGALAVTGNGTVAGYQVIGGTTRTSNNEKLRVVGDVYVDGAQNMGNLAKKVAVKWVGRTSGGNTGLFWMTNAIGSTPNYSAVKVKIWLFNTDVQAGYASLYVELVWKVKGSGGSDISSVVTLATSGESINSAIINFSALNADTGLFGGGTEILFIAPSIVGSAGSSTYSVYAEAESLGDLAADISPAPTP